MAEKGGSFLSFLFSGFRRDGMAMSGLCVMCMIFLLAVCAPLLANGRPLLLFENGALSSPALHFLFAPDGSEVAVEKTFNFLLLFLPVFALLCVAERFLKPGRRTFWAVVAAAAVVCAVPFFLAGSRVDKRDWRAACAAMKKGDFAVFAPVPYGPFEICAPPYEKGSASHIFGSDQIGRDVFSRMLYGARVSLAVGFLATALSMFIGVSVGMTAGYFGGGVDMIVMRAVEIVICFPTFLLLLILMALMMDYKFEQSILVVIAIIGLTGWTGVCRLVRGETLQQRQLTYVRACEALSVPVWRIMLFHLLPNVAGTALVAFTFSVAGAMLSESGLSFLGFGVQDPTASWGELLRQAFSDPFSYWNLTLWPGLALFLSVCSINFMGEGVRKAVDPRT